MVGFGSLTQTLQAGGATPASGCCAFSPGSPRARAVASRATAKRFMGPLLSRRRSELEGAPEGEALDGPALGPGGHEAPAVDVVELELDVRVPVPVQAGRVLAVGAAPDGVVVQVDAAVAVHDFPCS